MKSSLDIKKVAKNILRHQKGLHDMQIMHPAREWFLGVLIALIILVGSSIWGLVTYLENKEVEFTGDIGSQNEGQVYKEDLVRDALAVFETKAQIRDANTIVVASEPVVEEEVATTTEEVIEEIEEVVDEEDVIEE